MTKKAEHPQGRQNLRQGKRFAGDRKCSGDNFDEESDVDILILLKRKTWNWREKICDIANEAHLKYKANISPTILSEEEFAQNVSHNTAFSKSILQTGIPL